MRTASSNAEADRGRRRRPILAVNNIEVVYNHVILVLKGVSLTVPPSWIVALVPVGNSHSDMGCRFLQIRCRPSVRRCFCTAPGSTNVSMPASRLTSQR